MDDIYPRLSDQELDEVLEEIYKNPMGHDPYLVRLLHESQKDRATIRMLKAEVRAMNHKTACCGVYRMSKKDK